MVRTVNFCPDPGSVYARRRRQQIMIKYHLNKILFNRMIKDATYNI